MLTGCQCPDHNTLRRFYKAHRPVAINRDGTGLLKGTVQTAAEVEIVDEAQPKAAFRPIFSVARSGVAFALSPTLSLKGEGIV